MARARTNTCAAKGLSGEHEPVTMLGCTSRDPLPHGSPVKRKWIGQRLADPAGSVVLAEISWRLPSHGMIARSALACWRHGRDGSPAGMGAGLRGSTGGERSANVS